MQLYHSTAPKANIFSVKKDTFASSKFSPQIWCPAFAMLRPAPKALADGVSGQAACLPERESAEAGPQKLRCGSPVSDIATNRDCPQKLRY
jgi:hypothetical protein